MSALSRRETRYFGAGLLAWLLLLPASPLAAATPCREDLRGQALGAALHRLQQEGRSIFFSEELVRPEQRVAQAPCGADLAALLADLLRPHGLVARASVRGRLVVARASPERPAPVAPPPRLEPAPVAGVQESIDVVSTGLGAEGVGRLRLDARATEELPAAGDDWLRASTRLSGVVSGEGSARLRVQGGRDDELMVVLDGLELLAPYHLQEFDSALSIVAPGAVDAVALLKGGYSAAYGDRMGGVLEMSTVDPVSADRLQLAVGVLYGELAAAGAFRDPRWHWQIAGRSGSQRVALEINGRNLDPRYSDLIGKIEFQGRSRSLRGHLLLAGDSFSQGGPNSVETYSTEWGNHYLWLDHAAVVARDAFVETILSFGRIDRDREGLSKTQGASFLVDDEREMQSFALQQSGHLERGAWTWQAGYQLRTLETEVEYLNERSLQGVLAPLRSLPAEGSTFFEGSFDFDQVGAYVSAGWRPADRLEVDLGLRYDQIGLTRDQRFSPRFDLAWQAGGSTRLRLAWGHFYQSQRPYELQAEDGETTLADSERAEHRVLELNQQLGGGWQLRAELYQRRFTATRPRYENLFDPELVFPEFGEDRVRFDPSSGRAEGVDLSLSSPPGRPFSFTATAAWSHAFDREAGFEIPRAGDQPFAGRLEALYRWGRGAGARPWSLAAAWQWHEGWPTTEVLVDDGRVFYGPRNGERLADYHRLDLRLARTWTLRRGEIAAFLDLQNVYDRQNQRGFDQFRLGVDAAGRTVVLAEPTPWGGLLPTAGIRYRH